MWKEKECEHNKQTDHVDSSALMTSLSDTGHHPKIQSPIGPIRSFCKKIKSKNTFFQPVFIKNGKMTKSYMKIDS